MANELYRVKAGDKIRALGYTFDVDKIMYQDVWEGYDDRPNADRSEKKVLYDIEFTDSNGGYHHWKSNLDGGYVIKA